MLMLLDSTKIIVEGLKLEYFALDNDMYFKLFKAIKMLKLFKCHLTT